MSTILVINDDPVQLHLLGSLLEPDYDRVVRFACSESAWQWLQEGHVPDGIVLDLHMPGINGWRFCELLHSVYGQGKPVPPVLAVSATYSGADARELLIDLGASAFLPLPADAGQIRQQVRLLVERQPSPKQLHVWAVSSNETEIQRIHYAFAERGWQVSGRQSGAEVLSVSVSTLPDIVILDDPLPDMASEDVVRWCKHEFSHVMCIVLSPRCTEPGIPILGSEADAYMPKGCDPLSLITLCEKGRWERTLSHVEHLLEARTSDLRESESQFKQLFEMLPDVLVIYDAQGVVQHINAVGAQQLGYSPDALVGTPFPRIQSDSCIESTITTIGESGSANPMWAEALLRKKDGTDFPVEILQRAVRFQGHNQTLLVARDMTARQNMARENATLEQQLRQVQKMEAVGRLASGVAHDMNNILTAILAHASLVKVRADESNPSWKAGDIIEKAVRRGKELTSQLLGFTRQGKHHHISVDVHAVIQEVIGLLSRTVNKTITFHASLLAGEAGVVGDPNQLYQVLMNLAVNGCDAMSHNGQLIFQTSNETVTSEQAAHVPGLSAGDYVVIRVTDTGEGIPQEIQGHIFEPFFTTKDQGKGSGMGLAMVYGIVKNHRGYIGVTSTLEVGTTMRVYLPSVPFTQPQPQQKAVSTAVSLGRTGHVLVIDDERDVAEAAQAILEYVGYDTTVFLKGEEAVAFCQQPDNPVDVVLLDMVMPDLSGTECYAQMRTIRPDVKVILCTGYDRNHAVQTLLDQGVMGFIQKPYDLEKLATVVAEVIQQETPSTGCLTGESA